jgi:succinate dehydrogenase / fumarate reductase cytochrome b subunit
MGIKQVQIVGTKDSPMPFLGAKNERTITAAFIKDVKEQTQGKYDLELKNGTTLINKVDGEIVFIGFKDLHKLTVDFFRDAKLGLVFTIGYVLAMLALAFHLWHGFQSAFQSLGINNKFTPSIKFFGRAFAIIVPLLFAIIPIILHFKK